MECLPGETEGEGTKQRGQESKLNGRTILCHPGDPVTFPRAPAVIQSLAIKPKGFLWIRKRVLYKKDISLSAKCMQRPLPGLTPDCLKCLEKPRWNPRPPSVIFKVSSSRQKPPLIPLIRPLCATSGFPDLQLCDYATCVTSTVRLRPFLQLSLQLSFWAVGAFAHLAVTF